MTAAALLLPLLRFTELLGLKRRNEVVGACETVEEEDEGAL